MPTCPSCEDITGLSTLSCPRCGESIPLHPGAEIGGRYEIVERLGAGGMGTVYRARDRDLDQDVAIKLVRMGAHAQAVARFKSEIRLARKVRHRNVCAVWQNGYQDEFAYIVMELIRGRTLRDLVKEQGPLAWDRACSLALQAARGIEAIHEAGVIHRDVKSSNLMLDTSGIVRLLDFGLAKGDPTQPGIDLTDGRRITDSGQVVGSPEYMSPEQILGQPLDARTDLYSFGIVVYELFTGRVPFRGTSAIETMRLHVLEPPPLEGAAAAAIPPVMLSVLRRALAKSRDDRHPSMRALIKDLEQARTVVAGGRTDPSPPPGESATPWWRRAEVWAPLGGLVLGLTFLRAVSESPAPLEPAGSSREGSPPGPPVTPLPEVAPARGTFYAEGEPGLVRPSCLDCPTRSPSNLERAGLRGVVPVEILVDEEGRVRQPRALGNAHEDEKAAAVEAVKTWRYRPATRLGVPGKMRIVVDVDFRRDGTSRR